MKLEIPKNCCATARKLIAAGLDSNEILEFCRGDMVCLYGKAGTFARFQVREDEWVGPLHVKWRGTLDLVLEGARGCDV